MWRNAFLLAAFLIPFHLLSSAAIGDILLLDGGGKVEGVVTEKGKTVEVRSLHGTVIVKRSEILDRVVTPYVTELYVERVRKMDTADADAHFRLFRWCVKNGLKKRAELHLTKTIALDPDHAEARAVLGHVKFSGVWLTADEAREAAMARGGFIRYEGRWFTESGLLAFLDARREEKRIAAEMAVRQAEREALARKAREEEERIKLLQAERKLVEDALASAAETRRERDALIAQNRELIDLLRDLSWNSGWYGSTGVILGGYGGWGYSRRARCRPRVAHYGARVGFSYNGGNFRVRGVLR